MSKIKITYEQYNRLILNEQKNRSHKINLNEDMKEVLLGISLMMGIGLSGQNKEVAENALKNDSSMLEIKKVLEDSNKLNQLVDALTEKGYNDAEIKMAKKANEVVNKFNDYAESNNIKHRLDTKAFNNLVKLDNELAKKTLPDA